MLVFCDLFYHNGDLNPVNITESVYKEEVRGLSHSFSQAFLPVFYGILNRPPPCQILFRYTWRSDTQQVEELHTIHEFEHCSTLRYNNTNIIERNEYG
jgi:hypothetical protein